MIAEAAVGTPVTAVNTGQVKPVAQVGKKRASLSVGSDYHFRSYVPEAFSISNATYKCLETIMSGSQINVITSNNTRHLKKVLLSAIVLSSVCYGCGW